MSEPPRRESDGDREKELLSARSSPTRCPYCHEEVESQGATVCRDCLARHHASCWEELGTCASCAAGVPLVEGAPTSDEGPPGARPASKGKRWVTLIKFALAAALIGILVKRGSFDPAAFEQALTQPLTLVMVVVLAAIGISLSGVRWMLLMRAEGMQIPLKTALQLTWIGHFFNMVFPGSVSGDAVKMYYVGFIFPESKEEAWTTVVADRVVGLLGLVAMGAVAALSNFDMMWGRPPLRALFLTMMVILGVALVGCLLLALGLGDRITSHRLFERLPLSGLVKRATLVFARLARRPGVLTITFLMSFGAHWLSITNGYLLGQAAVPDQVLTYMDYCSLMPVALFSNAVPLTPGGIGVGEGVLSQLFVWSGGQASVGMTVMLLYRAVFLLLALFGAVLYLVYKGGDPRGAGAQTVPPSACDRSP